MIHRLVTLTKKGTVGPGQSLEMAFRPGIAKNMSATADLSEDALVELDMLDAAGNVVDSDPLSRAPVVNYQPAAVADFRARAINRSSVQLVVVLAVSYYIDEELPSTSIPTDKVIRVAQRVLHEELQPRITLQGKHLTITGDPSLTTPLAKWTDCDLDLPVDIDGLEITGESISVAFEDASDDYPFGALVLKLQCTRQITLTKYKIGTVRIPQPTFTLRAGVNVYGGSIHLAPVKLELPKLDPGLVATIGQWIFGVISDATQSAMRAIDGAVADLESNGTLEKVTRTVERVLDISQLRNIKVSAAAMLLEYDSDVRSGPVPVVTAAPRPRSNRLEHLIIVMQENRSFDHMMADIVRNRSDVTRGPDDYSETLPDGRQFRRAVTALRALPEDPPHDSKSQELQADHQFVKSFLQAFPNSPNGAEVLAYQPRKSLPFYDFLAREFVICDNWRAALLGHTWPNRQYSLSGASNKTSKGYRDNPAFAELELYTIPTICDVLEAQGIDWAYYKEDFAFLELYRRWVFDRTRILDRAAFDDAIAKGTLPTVTWFEPNISDFGQSVGTDDHPPISVFGGQRLLAELYGKLCSLPTANWMLVITYDESGGFYDSVAPELAPDDQQDAAHQGFRVPAFLVSPWLAAGKVDSHRYDHASLIKTILDNFCAPEPIFVANKRVASAASLANLLEEGSPLSIHSPRSMPVFTAPLPDIGLGLAEALPTGRVQPKHPLFIAFEAAKRQLLAEQAVQRAPADMLQMAGALQATLPAAPMVHFEGLYLETRTLPQPLVDLGWTSRPLFDDALEARPPAPLAVDVAWDLVHDLRARFPDLHVDPLWETVFPALDADAPAADLQIAGAPANPHWHLEQLRANEAWKLEPTRGDGVVIGHLDTGYRDHPDLAPMLMPGYGWDVYRDDSDPHDDMERGFLKFPGHGTATASVIGSRGTASNVIGTAPEVHAIPFRISASVVHMSMSNMVRGIQMAMERNVHIISLSAGGLWSSALHRAVREATQAGVIVVAAAGNYTEIVVWPARFDEIISCGAVNVTGEDWRFSNGGRGPHVTVMAPGEDVWVLRPSSTTEITVAPGSGTSFATACVAGAVAIWLAHHGRAKLVETYGRENLARVAKYVVRTCSANGDSAGLLDMSKLLETPLPDLAALPPDAVTDLDPLQHGLDMLKLAGTPLATVADEAAFHDTVAKLSRRAPVAATQAAALPLGTLGAAIVAPAAVRTSARLALARREAGAK